MAYSTVYKGLQRITIASKNWNICNISINTLLYTHLDKIVCTQHTGACTVHDPHARTRTHTHTHTHTHTMTTELETPNLISNSVTHTRYIQARTHARMHALTITIHTTQHTHKYTHTVTHTLFFSNFFLFDSIELTNNTIYEYKHKKEHSSGMYNIDNFTNHYAILF